MDNINNKSYKFHSVTSKSDEKEAYILWEQCFGDTKEYMDFYFQSKCKENIILALFEEEEKEYELSITERNTDVQTMASMLHLNPYTLKFNDRIITAHYIVGVATRPVNRKQGLMRYLMEMALNKMYDSGEIFTYLMPAKEEIYLPFDFRFVYEQDRYVKIRDNSPKQAETYDERLSVVSWKETDRENEQKAVLFVGSILSQSKNIYAIHDKDYYDKTYKEMQAAGGDILLFYIEDSLAGVLSYMHEGAKTEVIEAVLDCEYTEEVIKYFENLFLREETEIIWYDSSFMRKTVLENRNYIEKKVPIIMARIVNLINFFQHLETTLPMYIILEVKDGILLENNQTFILDYREKGQKQISITNQKPQLVIDIGTLTSFLLGNTETVQSDGDLGELKKIRRNPFLYLNEIT